MHSTLNPKLSDDPHDIVVVAPDSIRVSPDQELSDLLHEAAARHFSDPQTPAQTGSPAGSPIPAVDTTFRPAAVNDNPVAGPARSMARAAVRGFVALLLAACIGVAAFAWRAYGDAAEKKIAKWATQFALTVSLPSDKPGPATPPAAPAVQADAANAAPSQPTGPAQSAAQAVAPAASGPSADSAQLMQSMARDLAGLGQEVEQLKANIEQLKANQQQTSRDLARVSQSAKSSEPNPRPRTAAVASPAAPRAARKPAPSYPQAAAVPPLPPAAAPYVPRQVDSMPRQLEPPPQAMMERQLDPELSPVPRPPMPVR
jgi:hypothetical protein